MVKPLKGKSEYWLTSLIEKSFRVQSVLKFYNFVGGKKRRREFGNDYDLDSPSPWLTWDGIGFDKDLGPMGAPGNPMGSRENPMGAPENPMEVPRNPLGSRGNPMGAPGLSRGSPMGAPGNPMGAPGNARKGCTLNDAITFMCKTKKTEFSVGTF